MPHKGGEGRELGIYFGGGGEGPRTCASLPELVAGGDRVNGRDSIKIIPRNLGDYLTPLALAIWLLNVGFGRRRGSAYSKQGYAKKLVPAGAGVNLDPAFGVSRDDVEYLCDILKNKYSLDTTIQSKGKNKGETLFISSSSMAVISKIVKPLKETLKPYPSILDHRFKT